MNQSTSFTAFDLDTVFKQALLAWHLAECDNKRVGFIVAGAPQCNTSIVLNLSKLKEMHELYKLVTLVSLECVHNIYLTVSNFYSKPIIWY